PSETARLTLPGRRDGAARADAGDAQQSGPVCRVHSRRVARLALGNEISLTNDYVGEPLAIAEYNHENADRKITPVYHLLA
ncbi:MAG: hypothetical protein ACT4NU_13105, partial [Chromatiales bacterium]